MTETPQRIGFESAMIVDDHPLFLDALSMTLKAVVGIREIETASALEEALDALTRGIEPDVIVLDLNLPDVNGLDGLARLRTLADKTPILVVSSMTDARIIASCIKAGARGFVPKHSQRDVFRAAFEKLSEGAVFVPEGVTLPRQTEEDAPATSHDEAASRIAQLTRQQAKILQLICAGKLNKQIAYDLSIAETTVKAHVTAIMRKLGVQSRTQAVLIAQQASFSSVLQD